VSIHLPGRAVGTVGDPYPPETGDERPERFLDTAEYVVVPNGAAANGGPAISRRRPAAVKPHDWEPAPEQVQTARSRRSLADRLAPASLVRLRWFDEAVVASVVVLAFLPYLTGIVTPGVLGFNSGLATELVGPWLGSHVGLPWLDPNVGFVSQALGHLAGMDMLHGHIPWWNPYEAVGVPLAGEGQSAALFPLTALFALPDGQVLFELSLPLIAGIATVRLLKELGFSRWIAVVGGIMFALNGTFAWLTNAASNPVAFLPLILLGIERSRHRPLREGCSGWVMIAAGAALSVYAGFPETAFLNALLAAAWAILRLVQQPNRERAAFSVTCGVGGLVGLALSAPFFIAFSSAVTNADIGAHAGVSGLVGLPTAAANTVGLPYLFGPLFGFTGSAHGTTLTQIWGSVGGFVTAATILLAIYGLLAGKDRGLRILLGVWIGIVLARTFDVSLLVHALNVIPGMHSVFFSRYAFASLELAMVVLAAVGLGSIGDRTRRERPAWMLVLAGAATLTVIAVDLLAANDLLRSLSRHSGFDSYPVAAVAWALSTVLLLIVVGVLARPPIAVAGMGVILVLDSLFMFMVPELSAPSQIPVDAAPVTFLQQHLGLQRFVTLGPIVPNYGSYFTVAEANAHDLPLPGSWAAFVHDHLEANELPQQFDGSTSILHQGPTPSDELQLNLSQYQSIGVKYVIAPSEWAGIPGTVVFSDRYFKIWQLPDPTPFYWVVSGSCHITPISFDQAWTVCSTPSVILRSELNAPGWSASVNGAPTPMLETGPLFASVHVPAGVSDISFNYLPPHMMYGYAIAFAGGMVAVVALLVPRRLRRRALAATHGPRHARIGTPPQPTGNGNGHPPAHVGAAVEGNGHTGNGHAGNGHAGNGHAGNGPAGNGHAGNGHASPVNWAHPLEPEPPSGRPPV